MGDKSFSLRILQGDAQRDLGEQGAELAGPEVEYVQGVVPVDPYAQHADGQQVLGGELIGSFGPVSASAKPLKVCARVLCPSRPVGTEIRLNQLGSEAGTRQSCSCGLKQL